MVVADTGSAAVPESYMRTGTGLPGVLIAIVITTFTETIATTFVTE